MVHLDGVVDVAASVDDDLTMRPRFALHPRDSAAASEAGEWVATEASLYPVAETGVELARMAVRDALRERFEVERRRSAFFAFLAGAGTGIIVTDTWISHWAGVAGGFFAGGLAYGAVFGYETLMWRRRHG
jgi:hypothetical protein